MKISLIVAPIRRHGHGFLSLAVFIAVFSAAALTVRVAAAETATFTVNTADDVNNGACNSSHCSLREAIIAASGAADLDTISFNLPGPGPYTIRPGSGYPVSNFPVIIDGTTQPGYVDKPIVELDGSLTGPGSIGLNFRGGGSTVRGLVINRFKRQGISLLARGSYLIENNYIGTDMTGTAARGNGEHGITVSREFFANAQNRFVGNVISANVGDGILLGGDGANAIQGNHIGTDVTGTRALGNTRHGIWINSPDNVVGGTELGARNVVSANGTQGIRIGGSSGILTGNVIQGNYIGTDVSGTVALGNGHDGIFTIGSNTTIGGADAGGRNIISANGSNGILISGGSTGSLVQGNLIGTAADGTSPLGNGLAGIEAASAAGTAIGGTAPGAGNTIAYSGGDGVLVGQSTTDARWSGNGILSNSIFSNGELGIDLRTGTAAPGVSPNDPGDADRGPNELQNFPVLTGASGSTVAGTLNSIANTSFRLEFFANREADPSGHGEGERFLGATNVTTDGSGNASFGFASPTPLGGQYVSATATDPANNTSEFSRVLLATGPAPPAALTLSPATATNDVGVTHCVKATVRDGSGNPLANVTVRFSVSGANSASGSAPTDTNGEAQFCYTGTNAGEDTIVAFADTNGDGDQDPGEPGGTATKTYVAAAAAALTLTPGTASNPVGSRHCVTATVADASGNSISGVTVRFSVSGANSASGSAPTDTNGEAQFCYTGTKAGQDTIVAFADTNGDGDQDPGEPDGRATKTWSPPGLDHFKCYALAQDDDDHHHYHHGKVTLKDQFGRGDARVEGAVELCNPVSKDGGTVNRDEAHLVKHKIKPIGGKFWTRRVEVKNKFGTQTVEVRKPDRLAVPSSKSLSGDPGDPPTRLDHFQCYPLSKDDGHKGFTPRQVVLKDQFKEEKVRVLEPVALCNPVKKTHAGTVSPIGSAQEHLVCYTIKAGKFKSLKVNVRNQFGAATLRVKEPVELCVPSQKRELPPHDDNHDDEDED